MSIKHFEDLPLPELIDVITNFSSYESTEKLDGSQLIFGIDEIGLYTTRGNERFYSAEQYEINFSTTYRRFAHSALQASLSKLLAAGMVPGDQVEIEVLHGELPNVVPYSSDISRIIFLRTIAGSVNIDRLEQEFTDHSLTVTLQSPFTTDGVDVDHKMISSLWMFARTPVIEIDYKKLEAAIKDEVNHVRHFVYSDSTWPGYINYELATVNLSTVTKDIREQVKEHRTKVQNRLRDLFLPRLKYILLEQIVRHRGSKFGPADGWIEGVVLKHRTTGKMVKLVDKDVFGTVRVFAWAIRNSLKDISSLSEIEALLDKYNKEKHALTIQIPQLGKCYSYTGEIDKRTLETFAFKISQAKDEIR